MVFLRPSPSLEMPKVAARERGGQRGLFRSHNREHFAPSLSSLISFSDFCWEEIGRRRLREEDEFYWRASIKYVHTKGEGRYKNGRTMRTNSTAANKGGGVLKFQNTVNVLYGSPLVREGHNHSSTVSFIVRH